MKQYTGAAHCIISQTRIPPGEVTRLPYHRKKLRFATTSHCVVNRRSGRATARGPNSSLCL